MFKKTMGHPIVPIIIGWWVAADGPGDIVVRSSALIFIFVWFAVDVWPITAQFRAWRQIIFSFVVCSVGILLMVTMRWLLVQQLENQQSNTLSELKMATYVPRPEKGSFDLRRTVFTVTNNGEYPLTTQSVSCFLRRARDQSLDLYLDYELLHLKSAEHLQPRGDAASFTCFGSQPYSISHRVNCADVVVSFRYSIDSQPLDFRTKSWRFGSTDSDPSVWFQFPLDTPGSPCP
jgi:hypothetical protein